MESELTSSAVKYPVGEQSFESLRNEGFIYVDKTRYIERIVNGSKYYFLSRPRRFGKSLFLSLLKCFFEGKRHLFRGLYADTMDWDWTPHPVLYLDFNNRKYKNVEKLDNLLNDFLEEEERKYGIKETKSDFSGRFSRLIKMAAQKTGSKVVILVDEYDKPLVNNLHNPEQFNQYRDTLAELYSNFKSSADYIRLVFMTGVSRFSKLSVFSGLNNISDISLDEEYSAICSITESELIENFQYGIKRLAEKYSTSPEEEIGKLKRKYDGYHFSENCPDIYNPFSLLNVMSKVKYRNYWIESGTPTLLLEQLRKMDVDLKSLINKTCDESELSGLDIDGISPVPLFYQTGLPYNQELQCHIPNLSTWTPQ